ncbi:bifunctional lysine-specific demethylase and histidyl-hydroxylase NO66-like isoform X1 [Biomphalaria glabrata]
MKRVSAFSVFNSNVKKKAKEELVVARPPIKQDDKSMIPLRRAHSSQSMMVRNEKPKESGSGSKSKRFLNALRSGNIRESMRLSSKKNRPSSLTSLNQDSPFPGLAKISFAGPKVNDDTVKPVARKKLLDSTNQLALGSATDLSKNAQEQKSGDENTTRTSRQSVERSPKGKKDVTSDKTLKNAQTTPVSLKGSAKKSPKMTPVLPIESSCKNALNHSTPIATPKSSKSKDASVKMANSEDRDGRRGKKRKDLQVSNSGKKKRKIDRSFLKASVANQDLPYMYDSFTEASKLFECMIHPVKTDRFFSELWEKKPLLVKRHTADYNKGWFSTAELDKILRQENIQWGVNLDATSFINDKRETHNQMGRAHAPVVWDMYQAGCSLRLLNPQTYSRNVWKVLSILQEYFGCCVGANIYLTPPGTQGFAPHYDDIEAFILQLEGKKHWRLYNSRNNDEILPRFSSGNFSQLDLGEPILDTVLEAGDLLYFPRGTIHQGNATDEHSLHITVSCYQMNSWGDLLQKLLPAAVEIAMQENTEFRTGLPRNYLNYMGIVHSDKDIPERKSFIDQVTSLVTSLMEYLPVDSACDQMGKQFMFDSMPPVLSEGEKSCSIHAAGERWDPILKRVVGVSELQPDTVVKLIRRSAVRLLTEEEKVRVYYNVENARVYRTGEPNFIEITAEMAPAVEFLINAYPEYTSIESLPLENIADQLSIATILYEKGLLITGEPLETTYDEPGDDTDEGDL